MINGVTMKICVDDYILRTLKEDINDEDVSTNAVMPVNKQGSCLLYTSPSPRDISGSRMPSSA